jgi:hypothetical protein
VCDVELTGRDEADGPRRLGHGLHGHQIAAHVGVLDDRAHLAGLALGPAPLLALLRVGDRLLRGALGDCDALHAHGETGGIHHDEHRVEAAVLLADEVADAPSPPSPNFITQVGEAWMPSLCSIGAAQITLRAPACRRR